MKLATIERRLIDAAVEFGRNEKALRDERRAEREHPCTDLDRDEPEVGYVGRGACHTIPEMDGLDPNDWCDNCRIKMALRENRTGNRRLRQLAKERIVRLARLIDNVVACGETQIEQQRNNS